MNIKRVAAIVIAIILISVLIPGVPIFYHMFMINWVQAILMLLSLIIIFANPSIAAWHAIKGQPIDFISIPAEAVWLKRIADLLLLVSIAAIFIYSFKWIPMEVFMGVLLVWLLYVNGISLFFRIHKFFNGIKAAG